LKSICLAQEEAIPESVSVIQVYIYQDFNPPRQDFEGPEFSRHHKISQQMLTTLTQIRLKMSCIEGWEIY